MSDTVPNLALNMMTLVFDTFYLVRDIDVANSKDLEEYLRSGYWVHDDAKQGWTCPRTPLIVEEGAGRMSRGDEQP